MRESVYKKVMKEVNEIVSTKLFCDECKKLFEEFKEMPAFFSALTLTLRQGTGETLATSSLLAEYSQNVSS